MDNLYIAPTPSSPEVDFRFDTHTLHLRGESYPENAAAFYGGILTRLLQRLRGLVGLLRRGFHRLRHRVHPFAQGRCRLLGGLGLGGRRHGLG